MNGHEIGHLHGEGLVDLPFPVRMRQELVGAGKARCITCCLGQDGSASGSANPRTSRALELFRTNYERLTARKGAEA